MTLNISGINFNIHEVEYITNFLQTAKYLNNIFLFHEVEYVTVTYIDSGPSTFLKRKKDSSIGGYL